jgi:hypothetical protein
VDINADVFRCHAVVSEKVSCSCAHAILLDSLKLTI